MQIINVGHGKMGKMEISGRRPMFQWELKGLREDGKFGKVMESHGVLKDSKSTNSAM